MEVTLLNVLLRLRRELLLPVTTQVLKRELLSHYSYPSILSFSNALSKIGVKHRTGTIRSEDLQKITPIFIAATTQDGLVIIKEVSSSKIKYLSGNSRRAIIETFDDFLLKWNGIVLLFEDESKVIIPKKDLITKQLKNFRVIGLIILLSLIISFINQLPGVLLGLMLIKLLGASTITIIIISVLDRTIEARYCTSDKILNCTAVSKSKGSRIFSWLSLSDLGLVYFFGGFLTLFLSAISGYYLVVISLLFITSILSFPIVFYSVYYQYSVIKKWCKLCLIIIGLITIESVLALNFLLKDNFEISVYGILMVLGTFLFTSLIWSSLKNPLSDYFGLKELSLRYSRLKNDPYIMEALKQNSKIIKNKFVGNELVFGKSYNETKTTLVINPFCELCGKEIQKIYNEYLDFNFFLVFSDSKDKEVSLFLIELYFHLDNKTFLKELNFWFNKGQIDDLKERYKITISSKVNEIYQMQLKWCADNGILKTPTIIYDDHVLSQHYNLEDLYEYNLNP